jgi:RNA polymerase sigma-70 factor (ECF subfamily)
VTEEEDLAAGFEAQRPYLHAIAFRVLGSHADADDAVQEAWLRLARTGGDGIEDLRGWLTTVTGRICLDVLRRCGVRAEQPLKISAGMLPQKARDGRTGPEEEALLADTVGLALYVVMDALTPAERVSFVLHDVFEVPFGTIATILGRSTAATKMLASRARGRIRLGTPTAAADAAARRSSTRSTQRSAGATSRGCSPCSPRRRSFGCKVPREPSSCAVRARSRPGRPWVPVRTRWGIRRSSTVPRASSSRWAGGRS